MGDLNKYTVAALREELQSRELLTEDKKAVLMERLQKKFLNAELSVEQVDNANKGNANLVERGEEQPTENSIQQKLESVKRELISVRCEKELLQQKLDFQKHPKSERPRHQDREMTYLLEYNEGSYMPKRQRPSYNDI
ncbi:hypothetical protein ACFW04_003725 [Cataglyphis niger]